MFFKSKSGGGGSGLLDEKLINRRISKTMTVAERQSKKSVKLLILGGGGSGKTTLRKQFSRLYSEGFKDTQSRLDCREVIYHNLIEGMKQTVHAVEHRKGSTALPSQFLDAAATIKHLSEDFNFSGPSADEVIAAFRTLAADENVRDLLENRRNQFQIQECFLVYLPQLVQGFPTWGGADWTPSVDDCVRSRIRSSGIIEVEFTYESQVFKVYDAGGQRAERRKWLHAFDGVTALIYVCSLTEYNEVLFEDTTKNRLLESLEVWEGLVNSSHFTDVPILLFLNKLDLFEKQYAKQVDLNCTGLFPSAPAIGAPMAAGIEWIASEFRKRRHKGENNQIFVHTLSAVNGNNVDAVFKAVKEIILVRCMTADGLMM